MLEEHVRRKGQEEGLLELPKRPRHPPERRCVPVPHHVGARRPPRTVATGRRTQGAAASSTCTTAPRFRGPPGLRSLERVARVLVRPARRVPGPVEERGAQLREVRLGRRGAPVLPAAGVASAAAAFLGALVERQGMFLFRAADWSVLPVSRNFNDPTANARAQWLAV